MTTRTRLSVLLISTPLLGFIIVGGLRGNEAGGDPTFQHLRVFEDVVSLILNNYVETAKIDKVMEGAMRGMADGLDPDSSYLTAADVKAIDAVTLFDGHASQIAVKRVRTVAVVHDHEIAEAAERVGVRDHAVVHGAYRLVFRK